MARHRNDYIKKTAYDESMLFPELAGHLQKIHTVNESETEIHIFSKSLLRTASCPRCDEISPHLHATYQRVIQTVPLRGKYTCLHVTAYKFDCLNPCCPQKVFMEPLAFAAASQVRTSALTDLILALSVFLSDDGVSRVLSYPGARISTDTVRRITLSTPCISSFLDACPPGVSRARVWRQLEQWNLRGKKIRLNSTEQLASYAAAVSDMIPDCIFTQKQTRMFLSFLEKIAPHFFAGL